MSHDRRHFDEYENDEEEAEINRLIHNGFEKQKFLEWFGALKTKKEKILLSTRVYEFSLQAGMQRHHIREAYNMLHIKPDAKIDYAFSFKGNLADLEDWLLDSDSKTEEKFFLVLIHVFWLVEYPIYLECERYGACTHWWHRDLV